MTLSTSINPLAALAADSLPYPMADKPSLSRILLVDDDTDSLNLLKRLLLRDYHITCAHSGEEALSILARERFHLVVLDVVMRRISGLDVLAFIRNRAQTSDLPVILISGMAKNEDIVHGLQLGASDYITKPFDIEVVEARIKRHISTKRLLDERQQLIERLRDAQEVKERFLHMATHDLKNPLNNIRLAQFYLRDVVGQDPAARDALDAIEQTVIMMNELVEDFLDTAMLRGGEAELHLESVFVEEILFSVLAQYGAAANRKDITLLMNDAAGVALADSKRLMQIVSNLVSNAIKYSPFNTCVTVSARVIGDRVRICVADEGPGVPPAERDGLFKAFSKLSLRPTNNESSTGLGLWIVRELATLQRGIAGADFPDSGGAVFWVELPAAPPQTDLH